MASAEWNGQVIAKFPPNSLNREFLEDTTHHTTCPMKGKASYYNVVVNGKKLEHAAWFYPNPKPEVAQLKDYVAFWKGVEVTLK
ncbi:14539_t:CDS:2 [Entrophospora sp. SA101]|nr:6064_t:CDS:2 [Entrophospora sp. SA101]CAJ0745116.1 4871_t:CDS:2 [Entrophospora sp. SA101]CAJ0751361.1 14539_t:CDS:2 [Entrophospora sp. SA101]CAJ0836402.1 7335_t:CDS:2 [Entrophospora sp. SA101]CAJ0866168.1 7051_t:CDS:2 [Entrophospora sp. SA101]